MTYGKIQIQRDKIDLAISILDEARRAAENLGYEIQAATAGNLLAELNFGGAGRLA